MPNYRKKKKKEKRKKGKKKGNLLTRSQELTMQTRLCKNLHTNTHTFGTESEIQPDFGPTLEERWGPQTAAQIVINLNWP